MIGAAILKFSQLKFNCVGLTMNRSKAKLITNSIKRRVTVDGNVIHYVCEYTYLGQIVSFENRQGKNRQTYRRLEELQVYESTY